MTRRAKLALSMLESRLAPAIITVTDVADMGPGTLRQAIADAAALAGSDTIDFAPALAGKTIRPASVYSITDLDGVTIDGGGVITISGDTDANGSPDVPIFYNSVNSNITLESLILERGSFSAIRNLGGNLSISNSKITGNTGMQGGGVYNLGGTVNVLECELSGNVASDGGAIANFFSGIVNIVDSWITGNSATTGGGVLNSSNYSVLNLTRTVVANNSASSAGGGIASYSFSATTITECTINGNTAPASGGIRSNEAGALNIIDSTISGNSGGGVFKRYGQLMMRGSTISGNTSSGNGAGLFIRTSGATPDRITSCTITGNQSTSGASGIFIQQGAIRLESTIVAGNGLDIGGSVSPTISSFNLIGNADAAGGLVHGQDGNFVGNAGSGILPIQTILAPLTNNGGLTPTHALVVGSPAINAGANPLSLMFDQRGNGFPRELDGLPDIGSFERDPNIPSAVMMPIGTISSPMATPTIPVVVTYADNVGIQASSIDLSDVVMFDPYGKSIAPTSFNVDLPGDGTPRVVTYSFPVPSGGWDAFDNGDYSIQLKANQVTDTSGNAITGGPLGNFRVSIAGNFVVDNIGDNVDGILTTGQLTLREALLLTNGSVDSTDTITFGGSAFASPATIALGGSQLTISSPLVIQEPAIGKLTISGSGLSRILEISNVAVTMSNITLTGGAAGGLDGGAILNRGTLTLTGCHITGNSAQNGGGIANLGTLNFINGQLTANQANTRGGGVDISGATTISGSLISGNKATEGGGLRQSFGLLMVESSSLTNNSANLGGGMYGFGSISTSTLSGNVATSRGGAVYFRSYGTMTITDCTIISNSANQGGGVFNLAGAVNLRNCTLSANTAQQGGATYSTVFGFFASTITFHSSAVIGNTAVDGGGIFVSPDKTVFSNATSQVTLVSTIVAGNSTDVNGKLTTTSAFSLVGDAANAGGLVHGQNNNIVGNAGVGTIPLASVVTPLGNYGGATQVHALVPGSPALNAGSNPLMLATDQRGAGYIREVGSQVDIGPYELQSTFRVTSVGVGDGSAQRSRVTSLTINFDQPASVPMNLAAAIQLRRQSDSALVTLQATANGPSLVLTFTGGPVDHSSLADGKYTLTLVDAQFPGLDGNGDGIAGGNYELIGNTTTNKLFRLFGDADGNGSVSAIDFAAFRTVFGTGPSIFDFNGDGFTNATDFAAFRARFGITLMP